uniref:Uncharacterized protein n=1 Tax=Thermogemmatispora argillosa TaxID=2045280 RepID=A0A455T0Y8_9CHLR|nr:hypothetical protein KTA_02840 [Thermogemmatispora argillosa]
MTSRLCRRAPASAIEWSLGPEMHYPVIKDALIGLELIQPFLVKMQVATREGGAGAALSAGARRDATSSCVEQQLSKGEEKEHNMTASSEQDSESDQDLLFSHQARDGCKKERFG